MNIIKTAVEIITSLYLPVGRWKSMSISCSSYLLHAHAMFGCLEVNIEHMSNLLCTSRNRFKLNFILYSLVGQFDQT